MDWNAVASADTSILQDNVHPNPETGYDKFADTVKDAINAVSTVGVSANAGNGDFDAILSAKNANEYVFNVPGYSQWSAQWGDGDTENMKKLLENYGDLAYQLGRAVGAPYVAILVQMRYEDPNSVCGANNFWGNGCDPSHAYAGGATIQGKDLGEGFVQYAKTLTNGMHDQALGEPDPKLYLRKIGPTWVQGDPNGPGYAHIESMVKSVDSLMAFIESPEGQAIVSQFGHYNGTYRGGVQCTTSGGAGNGVTTLEIDGVTYAFPIAYATKENYLEDNSVHPSVLSSKANGWYHHNAAAVDLGIYYKMVTGKDFSPSDYPNWHTSDFAACGTDYGEKHCNSSTGAPVVSMTDGVIVYYDHYTGTSTSRLATADQQICAITKVKSSVGGQEEYLYIHLGWEDEFAGKVGQQVKVGDVIGHVGPTPCAQYTQAHVHVQYQPKDPKITPLIDKLYDALPKDAAELAAREQTNLSGLTDQQAEKLAAHYKTNADQGKWIVPSNSYGIWNCVSFTAYFVQRFTSIGKVSRTWGNGKDTAESLANDYNLPTGTAPKPFSVFSVTKGKTVCDDGFLCGHTGIVVAVNGNTVTTIEAAYGSVGYTGVEHRDISYFENAKYGHAFTYLDSIMTTTDLNEIIK